MKRSLSLISFLLVLLMVFIVPTASVCAEADAKEELIVLYTNDVHCATENYSVLAAYRAQLISEGFKVVTVDAGDAIQGEMIGSLTEGAAIVDIMNTVGYDVAVPGNHEFDYTVERLLEIAENEAEYDYICANFRYLPEEKDIFAPYAIFGKVAFIGIATPETYSKSTPTYFQDENGNFVYSFLEDDFYARVQSAIDRAIAEGAETVVAVGHLGIEGVTEGLRSSDVIANTVGIDAFIDAHAHQVIESQLQSSLNGESAIITSTGTKFDNVGKLTVYPDGSIKSELFDPEELKTLCVSGEAKSAFESVKRKIDAYNAEFDYLFEEIGVSDVFLTQSDENGNRAVRNAETNLGNFVTDAYIAVTDADVAMVNGGGVRAEIKEGSVTRKAVMDINPWSNEMCVIEVSGKQLLDALEYGVHAMPTEFGSFPHVAGITFEVHTYITSEVITDELGDFVSIPENAQRRVKNVKIGGKVLDESKTYTVAGTCYMLQLSGYKMFSGAKVIKQPSELKCDSEMLVEYFTEHLGGRITEEQYGNPKGEGRMTIVSKQPIADTGDGSANILWVSIGVISAFAALGIAKKRFDF
ncbi:MAG: bifunctional metallophosphatase/5'-nucleotidase [Clostridia bacterium]|nr:bifunctional metallophosphatase/5'-nucleotidase [Clostridia bacterium]